MTDETKRPRGRPRVAKPKKQNPLIQLRPTPAQVAFIEEAAWAKRRKRTKFCLDAALRDAARVLQKAAPRE